MNSKPPRFLVFEAWVCLVFWCFILFCCVVAFCAEKTQPDFLTPSVLLKGHKGAMRCAVFSSDGSQILTGSDDGTVRLWNAQTGKEIRCYDLCKANPKDWNTPTVRSVAFSPDEKQMIVGFTKLPPALFDLQAGNKVLTLQYIYDKNTSDRGNRADYVAFSKDGTKLVVGDDYQGTTLWDARTGKLLKGIREDIGVPWQPVSPDGKLRLCGVRPYSNENASGICTDKTWVDDAETGEELYSLQGMDRMISCATISPDSKKMLLGGFDGVVRIWEIPDKD